jgi:hypothetical protein
MSDAEELAALNEGRRDLITLYDGKILTTHGPANCMGEHCCIHAPSQHALDKAPLHWIQEMKMMFRVCAHSALHPDPDALEFHMLMSMAGRAPYYDGWHECCPTQCCNGDDPPRPQTRRVVDWD